MSRFSDVVISSSSCYPALVRTASCSDFEVGHLASEGTLRRESLVKV